MVNLSNVKPNFVEWKKEAESMKASAEIAAQAMDGANPCDMPDWVCAVRILKLIELLIDEKAKNI